MSKNKLEAFSKTDLLKKIGDTVPEIRQYILNNELLCAKGATPIAIMLEGAHGIGKTSIIKALANKLRYKMIFVSMGNFTEAADFTGYPKEEFLIQEGVKNPRWISNNEYKQLSAICPEEFKVLDSRMFYSPPKFIQELEPNTILFLDDFYRTTGQAVQASMDMILNQVHPALGKFPSNVTIIMSGNPSEDADNDYFGQELDPAQATRFVTFEVKADTKFWAAYAETNPTISSHFINFALKHGEIFEDPKMKINPRTYTLWAQAMLGTSITDKNYKFITDNAYRITKSENLGNLFMAFVNENLQNLFSPQQLLNENIESVKAHFREMSKISNGEAIMAIFGFRLVNYTQAFSLNDKETEQLINIIEYSMNNKDALPQDTCNFVISSIMKTKSEVFNKYLKNAKAHPEMVKIISKAITG